MGISFGSTIALKALQREPRRFPRAVVQGAFAHRRFTPAERLALFLGRRVPGTAARLPLRQTILTYNNRMDFPRIIEDRWPFYLEQNGLTPISALAHRCSLVARLDLRPGLARINADLLLIQGREDRIVPYRYFEELKAALPRSESVVMPTVGHIPHLTHAESLARLIGDWLLPCDREAARVIRRPGPPRAGPVGKTARLARRARSRLLRRSGKRLQSGTMIPGICSIPGRTPLARWELRDTMPGRERIDGVIVEGYGSWFGN